MQHRHTVGQQFVQAKADIDRVLRSGGVYVVNIIDGPPESFLRAEVATIAAVLPHVALLRGPSLLDGFIGNSVVVAGSEPLDVERWDALRRERGDRGELVDDLTAYLDGALVLTDDFAPVDQLIVGAR